jgi:hypothetical protein
MSPNAQRLLDAAQKLPPDERDWLAEQLLSGMNEETLSALEKEFGKPEPGYDEWFRTSVTEALADSSPDIPHEEAMKQFHEAIRRARKLKQSA